MRSQWAEMKKLFAFHFKIYMRARSTKMTTFAGLEFQDDPSLVLHYVLRFQYIDPMLQDAVLIFIARKI
jgi:hypothetical protein